ncbi:MAG: hypothetical protein QHD01_17235 [Bradyrhizobium sp.]|uniref:hypothetical protein n=1 Tax=Bradyrhizobium sp. TaxID=376 RepID=UPI0029B2DB5D|nr:hypothetical protein [Bradyrhizobium sp.]MDX3968326.1 hypothetical protein [Bradyrhizobium sp.]
MVFMMVNAVVVRRRHRARAADTFARQQLAVVLASFAVSTPISWFLSPRLRAPYWPVQRN